jgi:cytochrome c553
LLPIRLVALCATCHGDATTIPAPVQERLAALYPQDQATGFRDGDLRGWFWVEVPARP